MRKIVVIVLLSCIGMLDMHMMASDTIRIGMLLPLQTEAKRRDWMMDRFADFYTGALLAMYEMQEAGQPIEVYTYDIGKSLNQLSNVLSKDELRGCDMIIGPAYANQVHLMAQWSLTNGVRTLLPFSSEVPDLRHNPYLIQFNPSSQMEAEMVVKSLHAQAHDVRFLFISASENDMPESVCEVQQCIKHKGMDYTYVTISQIMSDSLSYYMSDSAENVILFNTERYGNIRLLMPYLARAAEEKELTLYSRYLWKNEKIAIPQVYSTVFKDAEEIADSEFEQLYDRFVSQSRTKLLPIYDLLGYDLTSFALQSIQLLRGQTEEEIEAVLTREFEGLQSRIQLERDGEEGGYHNTNIDVIKVQ